ncbi:MAG: plasmid pRiA4b ORF-3 family protein [Candidatus Cloacimonetes bacterium]|nr:plasmid pRiA4b ORF-3 family protein [Candidatus Cloacimonadota bacterium]
MRKQINQVYQFKITLIGSKPPIWRKIIVPGNYRFWDLHVAIQDAMGWGDCHLHQFNMHSTRTKRNVQIAHPEAEEQMKSTGEFIRDFFSLQNPAATYIYDFGDDWRHKLTLEKVTPEKEDVVYPLCTGGKGACPPEDCGGLGGYYYHLEVLKNPQSEDYEDVSEWYEDDFDPNKFEPEEVEFGDPHERQRLMETMV